MKKFFAVLLTCAVSQVNGQQNTSPVSSIRVIGEAVVTGKPERAQIDVGVLTQEKQSQSATTQNARQMDTVVTALHKLLGPDADIKTINFTLNPDYQYRPIGGKPSVSGYTAVNIVRVTIDDLNKVGSVIDTATQAGANHIESVRYTARDLQVLHSQAVHDAALKAKANAEALASALNLKIIRTLTVEETGEPPGPAPDAAGPDAGPVPTPVQPGSLVTTANVLLTVEVSSR
ncbi:MAG: SIMPL domain-containing protein [Sinobacteraceae bacterium]|nr:SIMPL domain-containing protein [Nevskiaceae bacterium]